MGLILARYSNSAMGLLQTITSHVKKKKKRYFTCLVVPSGILKVYEAVILTHRSYHHLIRAASNLVKASAATVLKMPQSP